MQPRRGFTLLELLLVLAVMTVVAAMTLPLLFGSMESQKLKRSGDKLRADWNRARVRAMKSGRVHLFQFHPGAGQYSVQTWMAADEDVQAVNNTAAVANPGQAQTTQWDENLPEGISFASSQSFDDTRAERIGQGTGIAGNGSSTMQGAGGGKPVLFYPDGTTSTARVLLVNERQQYLLVDLRGLTGLSQVSDILSANELPK